MSDVDEVYRKPQKPPHRQRRGGKRPWIGKKTIGADKMHQDMGVDNKIPHAEPDKTLSTPSKDQTVVSEVLVSSHSKDITESEGVEQTAETDRNLDESEPGESDVEKTSTDHKIEKGDSEHGEEEEDIEALKMKLDQLKEMLLELEDSSDSSGVSSDSCDEREKKQDKCGQASPRSEKAEESRTTNQNASEASQKEERRKSSTHKSGREHKRDDRGVTGHKDFSPKRKIDDKYNKEVKSSDEKSKMSVKRSAQPQDCDHSRSRSRALKGETSNRSKSVSSSDRSSRTKSRHSSSDSYRKSSSSRDKFSYYKSDSHGYHKKSSRYHHEHEKRKTHYQLKDKKSRETDSRSEDRKKYGSIHRSRDSSHTSQKQTFVRQSESEDEFKEKSVLKGKDDKAQDGKLQVDEPSSASRDPVICHRHVNQLFIRGDNIVMVAIMK